MFTKTTDGGWEAWTSKRVKIPGKFTSRLMAEKALRKYKIQSEVVLPKNAVKKNKKEED